MELRWRGARDQRHARDNFWRICHPAIGVYVTCLSRVEKLKTMVQRGLVPLSIDCCCSVHHRVSTLGSDRDGFKPHARKRSSRVSIDTFADSQISPRPPPRWRTNPTDRRRCSRNSSLNPQSPSSHQPKRLHWRNRPPPPHPKSPPPPPMASPGSQTTTPWTRTMKCSSPRLPRYRDHRPVLLRQVRVRVVVDSSHYRRLRSRAF